MSRIEKAIEVATRQRNKTEIDPSADEGLSTKRVKVSPPKAPQIRDPNTALKITNPYLVTVNDLNSPAAEQYRKLKSLIVKLSKIGDFEKALMITSPIANEGKTVTALNLSITMAQEFDHTVLLVEADIRKPSVLRYLGLNADKGLTDCVTKGLDVSETLIKTGIGNLSILPAGSQVENPVELFSSNRMVEIFDEIKNRYSNRFVIVDTTPLLPFAEPQYIANTIGAVLLVVREGVTTQEKLKRSLEILKNNNLLGVVTNCVSRVNSMQGYYGYYGYR